MQNKQAIVGIIIAAVILLGAGGVFLFSKSRAPQTPNNTAVTASPTPAETSLNGTIKDIFASGENKKCDFSVKDEERESEGTVYSSEENANGIFKVTDNGKTSTSYIIKNDDTFYIWGDTLTTGIKMKISLDEMESKLSSDQYKGLNLSQKVSFTCTDWTVDATKFTPPSNIKFTDLGGVMVPSGTVSKTPTGSVSQCSACTALTGEARTACLTQLNCK